MAKKSLGTRLGEWFRELKKREPNSELVKLDSTYAFSTGIGEITKEAFINFINSFEPATDAERKLKAEALETIKNESVPLENFRNDFSAAYNEEPVTQSEDTKIAAPSGANMGSAVVTSTPDESWTDKTRRRREGETAISPSDEITGPQLDFSTYEKYAKLGLIGNEIAVQNYITNAQENGITIPAEDLEFLLAASADSPLRPVVQGNSVTLAPHAGYFVAAPIAGIIDNYASTQEISSYQKFLLENKIVSPDWFVGYEGKYGEPLRQSIQEVMDWIDRNLDATPGSDLYKQLMQEMETGQSVFFTKTQELNNEFSFERQLFNYGLKEFAKVTNANARYQEGEIAKQIIAKMDIPGPLEMKELVTDYFEAKLNRPPTDEELSTWSDKFYESYSLTAAKQRAKNEFLNNYNFALSTDAYQQLQQIGRDETKTFQPGTGKVDLSMFAIDSPEAVRDAQFEQEYGKVTKAIESGKQVRKMQQDMILYMFGA